MSERNWKGTNNKKDNLVSEKDSAEIDYNIKLLLLNLINLIEKLDNLLLEIIIESITIKKGFTNSTGCNLGKKNRSNHLVDPLTSIPIKGTKNSKIKDKKKI